MTKLPKKIHETISRELSNEYEVIKRVFLDSSYWQLNLHLVVLRVGRERRLIILRYWGDNSYSFLAGYANMQEVREEIAEQVRRNI